MVAWLLTGVASPYLQGSGPTEYEVKAAYLYNFGKFVQWPPRSAAGQTSSFAICVLGEDPFGAALNSAVAGESISGMSVVVERILKPQDAVDCRILFISSSEESGLSDILQALGGKSVLTVSDIPDFNQRGGIIQFVLENNEVHFEVNLDAARRAGLTLSSQLLKVAIRVRRHRRVLNN